MRSIRRWASFICVSAGITFAPQTVLASSCDPTFGNQILNWASNTAGRQSRDLADADFEARIFNYFLLAYDDLNKRVADTSERLSGISASIAADEGNPETVPVKQAIARQGSSTKLLNDLFKARTEIDEISRRHANIQTAPTETLFRLAGLHNVGRATLLESLQNLGDSAQQSMSARYSIYVSVTADENGNVSNASVKREADMVDTIVLAAASYLPTPYTIAIVIIYQIGRQAYEEEVCNKKIEEQKKKLKQAYELLPTVLITHDSLFKAYLDKYNVRLKAFEDQAKKIVGANTQLEEAWKKLFAYNMARSQAANAILTTEKVKELERNYSNSGDIDGIYNNIAMTRIAQKIADLNSYASQKQARLLSVCGNLDGQIAVEDQSDTLAYTKASLDLFAGRAEFVPLQRLVERSNAATLQAAKEVDEIAARLPIKPCNQSVPSRATTILRKLALSAATMKFSALTHQKARGRLAVKSADTGPVFSALVNNGGSLCVLIKNGVAYSCESPGSPGSAYGGGFNGGYNDPRSDVLGGANDGGYAVDNKRVGGDIAAVTSNVNSRIATTRARAAEAMAAFGDWKTKNGTFLDNQTAKGAELEQLSGQQLDAFTVANAAALAAAKAKLDEFLAQPADPSRTEELVRAVNAREVALPSLPADRIPVDAPVLPGVSARDRIYDPNSQAIVQRISRETQKLESLNSRPELKSLAETSLTSARLFSGSPGGDLLAQSLINDATSIRYFGTGRSDRLELAVIAEDGHVSRVVVTDPNALPANSLISRTRRFEDQRAIFDARARSVQDIVDAGQATPVQRNALTGATALSTSARQTYYGGDVIMGAELMHMAMIVLDVATSLTPVVSWGRDIYEAVTGRNMISGEELNTFERTVAILGAVSGGIAGEGPKIFRAIEHVAQIGESGQKAEHILQAANRMDHTIEWTTHAEEELVAADMVARNLGRDNVEAALDRGTRFWDVDKESIVAFEEVLKPGDWRAAAAVDPNNMKLVTVYPEVRSDSVLAEVASSANPLVKRFRMLPGY